MFKLSHWVGVSAILAGGAFVPLGVGAFAQTAPNNPVGEWTMKWSFDNSSTMAQWIGVHQICFLPNGTWYAMTFPAWGGRWFQKGNSPLGNGDHVSVNGNYDTNSGNDAFQLDFVHTDLMAGTWAEWRDNFTFVTWVRAYLTRNGACKASARMPTATKPSAHANPAGSPPRD